MTLQPAQEHCTLLSDEESTTESMWSAELQGLAAKEIQDARDLQKPILVGSKVPAEQLPNLCRA